MYKYKLWIGLVGETIETPENFYMELETFHITPDEIPEDLPVKGEIWDEAFPVFIGDEGNAWASLDFVLENFRYIKNWERGLSKGEFLCPHGHIDTYPYRYLGRLFLNCNVCNTQPWDEQITIVTKKLSEEDLSFNQGLIYHPSILFENWPLIRGGK